MGRTYGKRQIPTTPVLLQRAYWKLSSVTSTYISLTSTVSYCCTLAVHEVGKCSSFDGACCHPEHSWNSDRKYLENNYVSVVSKLMGLRRIKINEHLLKTYFILDAVLVAFGSIILFYFIIYLFI